MEKLFTIDESLLNKIEPHKVDKKGIVTYVIKLPDGKFLHWIETTNNRPMRVSRADMAMQSWSFIEQAQAMCDFLKELWSEERLKREARPDCTEFLSSNKTIIVEVKLPD